MPDRKPVSDYFKKKKYTHTFSRNLSQSYEVIRFLMKP